MKKDYVIPNIRVKAFNASVRLDSNSQLVQQQVSQAYTSINMTKVQTKDINWK